VSSGGAVLVSGATGRLGSAVAEAIAARAVPLVLTDVCREPLEALADRLAGSCSVRIVPADCTDPTAVADLAEAAVQHTGTLEACVVASGIEGPLGPTEQLDLQAVRALYEVNVFALLALMKAVVPQLRLQGAGRIVNIASGAGLAGNADMAAYSSSKHAVVGLTRSLSKELAPHGISVNAVCPGCIESPMMDRIEAGLAALRDGADASVVGAIPAGRYARVDEVASVVTYLALEAPVYLTGTALLVDGALYA
jgi:NAD(P)-dependent dehydrogenase (short-subunit alcohol dehydrogenase family)